VIAGDDLIWPVERASRRRVYLFTAGLASIAVSRWPSAVPLRCDVGGRNVFTVTCRQWYATHVDPLQRRRAER